MKHFLFIRHLVANEIVATVYIYEALGTLLLSNH